MTKMVYRLDNISFHHLNNITAIVDYVNNFAEKYNIDPDNVNLAVSGDSEWGIEFEVSCMTPETEADREKARKAAEDRDQWKIKEYNRLKKELGL